jgi:hypothetical protein
MLIFLIPQPRTGGNVAFVPQVFLFSMKTKEEHFKQILTVPSFSDQG